MTGFTVLCVIIPHKYLIEEESEYFLTLVLLNFLRNFNQLVCRIKLIVMDFYTKLKTVDPDE